MAITLGFSPCPNDTFIFYALAERKIVPAGPDFELRIEDVETLNGLAMKRALDVTKISCHAFYYLQEDYQFLRSGGAFGRGCGPLLVQRAEDRSHQQKVRKRKSEVRIAIPGELTTAFLLLKLYLPDESSPHSALRVPQFMVMPFNEIMGAVRDGKADAGLIIHESRFTYPDYGLVQAADLGEWWEKETGLPVPLGGIIAKKSLGAGTIEKIEGLIRESVKYAMAHRAETMPFIKRYSQELSDEVIKKHIGLYVNDYSVDMGDDGAEALAELLKRAGRACIAK